MPIQVRFEGLQQVKMHFETIRRRAPVAFREALIEALDIPFRESQRLVPVDKGDLKRSGKIDDSLGGGEVVIAEITYGNDQVPYAFWVHERLDLTHKPPTQAKFLEQPVKAFYPMMSSVIAGIMKGKGVTRK